MVCLLQCITLTVQFHEPALVLCQFCTRRHLVQLSLECCHCSGLSGQCYPRSSNTASQLFHSLLTLLRVCVRGFSLLRFSAIWNLNYRVEFNISPKEMDISLKKETVEAALLLHWQTTRVNKKSNQARNNTVLEEVYIFSQWRNCMDQVRQLKLAIGQCLSIFSVLLLLRWKGLVVVHIPLM